MPIWSSILARSVRIPQLRVAASGPSPLWTMVLSSRILERIGGMAHARAQCDGALRCEPLGESLLIQAGDIPLRGDVNRREDLLPYRMLDRLLMPVRPTGGVFLLPPWDENAAMEWLQRFQQPLVLHS